MGNLKKPHEGSLYERHVGRLFELSGFKVKYNRKYKTEDVYHEIDVIAQVGDIIIFVECKNVQPPFKKRIVDEWVGKLSDLEGNYTKAVLFVHLRGKNRERRNALELYHSYCRRRGIVFFDEDDVESLTHKLASFETNTEKQEHLLKEFSIERDKYLPAEMKIKVNDQVFFGIMAMVIGFFVFISPITSGGWRFFGFLLLAFGFGLVYDYNEKKKGREGLIKMLRKELSRRWDIRK